VGLKVAPSFLWREYGRQIVLEADFWDIRVAVSFVAVYVPIMALIEWCAFTCSCLFFRLLKYWYWWNKRRSVVYAMSLCACEIVAFEGTWYAGK
jgi:hypothetical protein